MANEQAPIGDAGPASGGGASERGTAPGRARRPVDLLEQVVAEGLLTAAQAREVRSLRLATGLPAAQCVADLGFVTEERIVAALSKITGLPVEDPLATPADPALVALIPLRTVRRRGVFPLRREGGAVVVATCAPRDVLAIDEARAHLGAPIRLVIAAPSKIAAAAERAYRPAQAALETLERVGGPAAAEGRTIEWHAEEAAHAAEGGALEDETVEAAAEAAVADSPVVKLVGLIFEDAVRRRASDIHIEPAEDGVYVRFRIDGVLRDVQTLPRSVRAFVTTRVKVNARMDPTITRRPQDARTTLLAEGRSIDARVSTLPTIHGEKIVVRLLDAGRDDLGLEKILPPEDLAAFESIVLRPQGLVLVTGPTGSGKTTTLYAALRRLSERSRNVVTLEDPVEYRLAGVNQVQVSSEMGFLDGLRSILRQDPDVVLIGEAIRDAETARVAFQAANTGQLVLSTLHTNDAAAAAARLFDLGAEPYAIAEGLNGIVAQRLCRRLCERCKSPSPATEAEVERWGATIRGASIQRPVGCEECDFDGHRGRVAAYEVLRVNAEVKAHLLERGSEQAIRRAARQAGMRSMLHAALARVLAGETSLEALERSIPHDAAQEERRCATCRADIFVGQRACTSCGAAVRPTCGACGAEVRPEWRFCGACSAPLEGADAAPAPPAAAADAPAPPARSAPDPASPVLVAGTGAFAERIALGLTAVGYAVLRAPTEAQALREALTRRVRAVVLDFDWERSHSLAQKLRRRLEMAGTPVLIAVEPAEIDARADEADEAEDAAQETPVATRPDDYVDRSLVPDEVGRRVGLAVRRGGRWAAPKGGDDAGSGPGR